ncbi:MAG: fibrobacter succinogenes major paralogous domain-containing protein [Bacteroidales bacterium]|nr:fibrobacter succinogenes major paralogous domain-containing protein [Bacteroidales bacterium]
MKKFLSTLFFCLVCLVIFAQAPQKFSYQAVVRDAGNNLVASHAVGVRISILQGGVTGNAVYMESQTITTNANGLMTVVIGNGTTLSGDIASIDWANGPYFLKTETDPNGGTNYTIEGTQQLLSVPYALYAGNAANGFSGNYNDLTNQPTIPTIPDNVSDFANDANYVNNADCNNVSFCDLLNMLTALQNTVDSLADVVAGNNPPIEEPCTPTSSTHDIEITTAELPYTFADTTSQAGTETGTYVLLRTNASGCDSTITLNLTVSAPAFACGTSTLTDVDGNTYNTVQIGEQCWMKENLRTTKKPNGTSISSGIWTPGSNSVTTYGRLYSWTTVMNGATSSNATPSGVQGICPTGWHVPSDNEWKQMEMAAGMSQSDADNTGWRGNIAAKLCGNTGWNSSTTANAAGNLSAPDRNSSGFSALPAGYYVGGYGYFGNYANFWSATEASSDYAYYRTLRYDYAGVDRNGNFKSYGYSVRCVRD